jgi:hypothetical protein
MELKERDTIEIVSNKVDVPHRRGIVQRVIEHDPLRIEVEWDDGHTSELIPSGGNVRVVQGSS